MSAGSYCVYVLASRHHGTIYIGVTNDIRARLELHRSGRGSKFVQSTRSSASFTSKPSQLRGKQSRARSNWSSGSGTGRSSWSKKRIPTGMTGRASS